MTALARHLAETKITQADFAARVGVNQATISKLCRGIIVPSLDLAVAIARETGGQVPVDVWARDAA